MDFLKTINDTMMTQVQGSKQGAVLCAQGTETYFFLTAAASMVPSWMDLAVADLNRDGGVSTVSKRCSRSFMQTG